MAYAQDVVYSTLVHLMPKFEELFLVGHPLLEKLYSGGGIERINLKGPTIEFTVITNGPGQVTGIRHGTETLASVRRNSAVRGSEQGFRAIYHFDIPGKDLAEASGEHDFAKLIDNYPAIAMSDFKDQFARQLASGTASAGSDVAGTGCDGFTTLNGSQAYNPQGTARTGIFQFSTTQTATVHGLPMQNAGSSPTTGWYHQYDDISSFSTNGLRTMRTLKQKAAQQSLQLEGGGVNLMFADQASYQNVVDNYDSQVIVNDKIANPASKFSGRDAIKFDNADLFWEPAIDLSDTTAWSNANAQGGVIFGLNTAYWRWFFLGHNADKATNGNFSAERPIKVPNQDAWQYRIVTYCNLYCESLRHQMLVTGTAAA